MSPCPALVLGRRLARTRRPIGFRPDDTAEHAETCPFSTYEGEVPLFTFAATGGGKTSGPVICTARTYPGQFICLDVKGEAYRHSADARRATGQEVHLIDLRDGQGATDALNPLEMAARLGEDMVAVARLLAAEMVERPGDQKRDFFWEDWAETMLTDGITYQMSQPPEQNRLSALYDLYMIDDPVFEIAKLLDTRQAIPRSAYACWGSFLQLPERGPDP